MRTLVMKFGGTSVGSAEAISQTTDIILKEKEVWDRLVVVVSAMSGVTDALTKGALTAAAGDSQAYRGIVADLRVLHYRTIDALLSPNGERGALFATVDEFLDAFETFCRSVHVLGEVTPRAMDAITSTGERLSARIVAALLRQRGLPSEAVDATEILITDDTFQNAAPLIDETRERVRGRLLPLLEAGVVPVVTGFIGATRDGVITTLGRGGSDYSAAIFADCLDADEVWIWTDVDGVMTTDPRLVPDARVIPTLSYSEVGELAFYGAKVVHPKTIRPVVERDMPLWVKNTFNPDFPGTLITRNAAGDVGRVKAVTATKNMSMVTVEGRGMIGVPGIAARTFAAVASQNTSVLMISQSSSEQSISFVIPAGSAQKVKQAVEKEMSLELARGDIDRIWSMDDVVIVTAVGAGMRQTTGIAASIFGALARGGVNVIAIAQGSSECSISLVVESDVALEAVRRIHAEAILPGLEKAKLSAEGEGR